MVVAVKDTNEKLPEDTKEKCVLLLEERKDVLEKNLENIKCKNIKNIGFLYFHKFSLRNKYRLRPREGFIMSSWHKAQFYINDRFGMCTHHL